eukprot:GHVN01044979.1.p1 GENE.GHVN01044979.1~~GHVN01044979.1.p1  ORF type:complete len:739 (-),score=80.99 GHVN01044979.1:1438-3654(-)
MDAESETLARFKEATKPLVHLHFSTTIDKKTKKRLIHLFTEPRTPLALRFKEHEIHAKDVSLSKNYAAFIGSVSFKTFAQLLRGFQCVPNKDFDVPVARIHFTTQPETQPAQDTCLTLLLTLNSDSTFLISIDKVTFKEKTLDTGFVERLILGHVVKDTSNKNAFFSSFASYFSLVGGKKKIHETFSHANTLLALGKYKEARQLYSTRALMSEDSEHCLDARFYALMIGFIEGSPCKVSPLLSLLEKTESKDIAVISKIMFLFGAVIERSDKSRLLSLLPQTCFYSLINKAQATLQDTKSKQLLFAALALETGDDSSLFERHTPLNRLLVLQHRRSSKAWPLLARGVPFRLLCCREFNSNTMPCGAITSVVLRYTKDASVIACIFKNQTDEEIRIDTVSLVVDGKCKCFQSMHLTVPPYTRHPLAMTFLTKKYPEEMRFFFQEGIFFTCRDRPVIDPLLLSVDKSIFWENETCEVLLSNHSPFVLKGVSVTVCFGGLSRRVSVGRLSAGKEETASIPLMGSGQTLAIQAEYVFEETRRTKSISLDVQTKKNILIGVDNALGLVQISNASHGIGHDVFLVEASRQNEMLRLNKKLEDGNTFTFSADAVGSCRSMQTLTLHYTVDGRPCQAEINARAAHEQVLLATAYKEEDGQGHVEYTLQNNTEHEIVYEMKKGAVRFEGRIRARGVVCEKEKASFGDGVFNHGRCFVRYKITLGQQTRAWRFSREVFLFVRKQPLGF